MPVGLLNHYYYVKKPPPPKKAPVGKKGKKGVSKKKAKTEPQQPEAPQQPSVPVAQPPGVQQMASEQPLQQPGEPPQPSVSLQQSVVAGQPSVQASEQPEQPLPAEPERVYVQQMLCYQHAPLQVLFNDPEVGLTTHTHTHARSLTHSSTHTGRVHAGSRLCGRSRIDVCECECVCVFPDARSTWQGSARHACLRRPSLTQRLLLASGPSTRYNRHTLRWQWYESSKDC